MAQGRGRNPRFFTDTESLDGRVAEVVETTLPRTIDELADEYDRRIGVRDRFVWKWIYRVFDEFTLSCVPPARFETVKTRKTELTMFVTILDDLADNFGDRETFEQARRIPQAPETVVVDDPGVDPVVLEFTRDLWKQVESGLEAAPRRATFTDVFSFDVRQVMNSIEYSQVLNDNIAMANLVGSRQYGPNNMVMFPYADIDLMYSPSFDTGELGQLRSLIWELQRMARIGNWLTTWEREVREEDFSAGVLVRALERGLVSEDGSAPEELIRRVKRAGIEREFRTEWDDRFQSVVSRDPDLDTVDTRRLIEGMRTVMEFHIASYGFK